MFLSYAYINTHVLLLSLISTKFAPGFQSLVSCNPKLFHMRSLETSSLFVAAFFFQSFRLAYRCRLMLLVTRVLLLNFAPTLNKVLFYSILFHDRDEVIAAVAFHLDSILFYSILFYSILFYSMLFYYTTQMQSLLLLHFT